jgi:arylsulfatase A-like enzyme
MTRAYTCTPLTLPSHSTLFTSTYPFTHGVRRNGFERLEPGSTTLAEVLQGAGFATEAITGSVVLRSTFGLNQGFDRYADVDARGAANEAMAERKGNQVADLALDALRRLRGGRFFLWVHFYDAHYPYESKEHPDSLSREAYADEVSFVDTQVGRILAELSDLGLAKRTVVVALGDHGEGLMDHGESEHGYFLYESTLRVPLVARGPGIPRGRTVAPVVRTLDVVPTVLDWLGVTAPEGLQGHDLRRVIDGHEGDPGLAAYGETHSPEEVFGLCTLRSLVRGDTKYILASEPEMYDLAADPGERQNLAPAQATRAGEMR